MTLERVECADEERHVRGRERWKEGNECNVNYGK